MKKKLFLMVMVSVVTLCGCSAKELGSMAADEVLKVADTINMTPIKEGLPGAVAQAQEQKQDEVKQTPPPINISENTYIISEGALEVHFIDVGQGDATLLICDDEAMLIDAGENDKGTLVQNYIFKQGIGKLKYVVGTHPDSDHYGGLDVVITKFECENVLLPDYKRENATSRDVYDAVEYKGYSVTVPKVGEKYMLGGAEVTILAPIHYDYEAKVNNYSVSLLVKHGNNEFLFTGDAEKEAEYDMVQSEVLSDVEVYKAGHHGSSTSSTEELINVVKPEYAVISCSLDNEYGHPHASVLNRFRKKGVKVFRTDEQGSVVAYSDGNNITWNCAPSETWKSGEFVNHN